MCNPAISRGIINNPIVIESMCRLQNLLICGWLCTFAELHYNTWFALQSTARGKEHECSWSDLEYGD